MLSNSIGRRPTHATVVSYIALFVALSGSAWAVATIGAGDIKKNAVRTKHIKPDTVNGGDVNESTLGTVPSAGSAATAASAANAELLDGMNSTDFLATGATAANAEQLDGQDSNAFAAAGHNHDSTYVNEGQANSVTAAMIANTSRMLSVPLTSLVDCSGAPLAEIPFVDGANAAPHLASLGAPGAGVVLRFDDDATPDEDYEVCSNFTVPTDFEAGGALLVRVDPAAVTGNSEQVECGVSVNGNPPSPGATSNFVSPSQGVFACAPTATYSGGNAVQFYLRINGAPTMDDAVDIFSVAFGYSSLQ
jgi:hypothetical protein